MSPVSTAHCYPPLKPTDKSTPIHLDQILAPDIFNSRHTRKSHTQSKFIAKQPQRQLHTFLPLVRQAPKNRPSHPHEIRSQRQRLEDIRPVPNPAINMHRNLLARGPSL